MTTVRIVIIDDKTGQTVATLKREMDEDDANKAADAIVDAVDMWTSAELTDE